MPHEDGRLNTGKLETNALPQEEATQRELEVANCEAGRIELRPVSPADLGHEHVGHRIRYERTSDSSYARIGTAVLTAITHGTTEYSLVFEDSGVEVTGTYDDGATIDLVMNQ